MKKVILILLIMSSMSFLGFCDSDDKLLENNLPSWVKDLGIKEIKNLEFLAEESTLTSKKTHDFNGFHFVYTHSDYDKVLGEAEKIAKELNIQENQFSPRKALILLGDLANNLPEQELLRFKGVFFTNCILGVDCNTDQTYAKAVNVMLEDNKWKLMISIVDIQDWLKQAEKFGGFPQKF